MIETEIEKMRLAEEQNNKMRRALLELAGFDMVPSLYMSPENDLEWHRQWRLNAKKIAGVAIGRINENS